MILVIILIVAVIAVTIITLKEDKEKKQQITKAKTEQNYKDKASQIGQQGEEYIIKLLGQSIPGQRYLVNNLIIEDKYGNTSQIDHIFINSNGVFVIETKNLSGTIYGNNKQKEWTQVFNYGKQKYNFYNPIMQNETHIRKLIEATGTNLPIKSIVVFTNNNIDKIESKNVYTPEGMIYEIYAYFKEKIKSEEMTAFYNQLCKIKATQISDEEHINNINKNRETI